MSGSYINLVLSHENGMYFYLFKHFKLSPLVIDYIIAVKISRNMENKNVYKYIFKNLKILKSTHDHNSLQ